MEAPATPRGNGDRSERSLSFLSPWKAAEIVDMAS
jgi:hypothetical protein